MYRVIVADDEPLIRMDIVEMLEAHGYEVVAEVQDGFDAIQQCRIHNPDFIILDIKMPMLDGLEAAAIINKEQIAGFVVLLTAYSDKAFAQRAVNADVMSYITKPIGEASFITSLEIAINKYREMDRMSKECGKAKKSLEERKMVDKAKGLLMDKKGLSEQSAYAYMRKTAMNKEATLAQVAQLIIEAYQ